MSKRKRIGTRRYSRNNRALSRALRAHRSRNEDNNEDIGEISPMTLVLVVVAGIALIYFLLRGHNRASPSEKLAGE